MVASAAREIRDGEVVFVGMRLPLIAFVVAKKTHAPNAVGLFENGVIRSTPAPELIYTMADPPNLLGATQCLDMLAVMSLLQSGRVNLGFLGAAEVDRFGNLNSTEVHGPKGLTRLPGSGGACDIASLAHRFVALLDHSKERLPERVSYLTSPGNGDGAGWRQRMGLPRGGPAAVITTKAVLRFGDDGEAYLSSVHPGVEVDDIVAQYRMEAAYSRQGFADAGAQCGRVEGDPGLRQRRILDQVAPLLPLKMTTSETMSRSRITMEIQPPVARICLHNPPLNVIDIAMMEELAAALGEIEARNDLSIILLSGDGKAFSVGVDVADHTPDKVAVMLTKFHAVIRALISTKKVTIASVHGHCLGGGAELAMVCDMVYTADNAAWGFPEIKLGCYPPVAATALAALVGQKHAAELMLTGRTISGQEAANIGLANRALPEEK